MLGRYTDPSTVGVYSASISLARLLTLPLTSLVFALTPICVRLAAQGDHVELARTYQITTQWVFAATLVPFFFFFFYPEWWLQMLFGDRFVLAATSLSYLSVGFLLSAFLGGNAMLMIVHGMTRALLALAGLGLTIAVIANYLLIHVLDLGATGAAAATMVTYSAVNVATSTWVYRRRGIHPFTRTHCATAAVLLFLGMLVYSIKQTIDSQAISMGVGFGVFVGGYLVLLWRMGDEQLKMIKGLLVLSERTRPPPDQPA